MYLIWKMNGTYVLLKCMLSLFSTCNMRLQLGEWLFWVCVCDKMLDEVVIVLKNGILNLFPEKKLFML